MKNKMVTLGATLVLATLVMIFVGTFHQQNATTVKADTAPQGATRVSGVFDIPVDQTRIPIPVNFTPCQIFVLTDITILGDPEAQNVYWHIDDLYRRLAYSGRTNEANVASQSFNTGLEFRDPPYIYYQAGGASTRVSFSGYLIPR